MQESDVGTVYFRFGKLSEPARLRSKIQLRVINTDVKCARHHNSLFPHRIENERMDAAHPRTQTLEVDSIYIYWLLFYISPERDLGFLHSRCQRRKYLLLRN